MMSSSRFEVRVEVPSTTTRPNGAFARDKLKSLLVCNHSVIVDMKGVVLTPSFADEFLGVLLVEMGEVKFRSSVKIVNVSDRSRPLLQTVLHRRAAKPHPVLPPRELASTCH